MDLSKRILLFLSMFVPFACAVLPLPNKDDFPLEPSMADTDTSCPELSGSYSKTPSLSVLSEGHHPRHEGTRYEYINLFMFGFVDDQKISTLPPLDPPLKESESFFRIIERDDQVLVDSLHADGRKMTRYDITALISKDCAADGTRWMLVDDLVGSSEGAFFNSRWIRKIAKSVNGDLLVYQVIVNAKPTMLKVVPVHYLFRFKPISGAPVVGK